MTAFPEYMDEGSILREYADGQARIIAEFCDTSSDAAVALPEEQRELLDRQAPSIEDGGCDVCDDPNCYRNQPARDAALPEEHCDPFYEQLEPVSPPVSRRVSLLEAITVIRDAQRCPDCGKTRAVINLGRGIRPEKVSPATHCSCVGGPAYTGIGGTL